MVEVIEKSRQCRKCNSNIFHKGHERICNSCRKTNNCIDCNKPIEPISKRCKSCSQIGKLNHRYGSFGELNGNYKDGRTNKEYKCIDCGCIISRYSGFYGDGRCSSCNYLNRDYGEENNPNWKKGITKIARRIRNLKLYTYWKFACLERDNYTCQRCNNKENLEVHHITSISELVKKYNIKNSKESKLEPEFWMLENGITYCVTCHCIEDKVRWFMFKKEVSRCPR